MKATFGAGCFWHVELAFSKLKGVLRTTVGFMGGRPKNPSYDMVSQGGTGHVEVVQLEYDPKLVSYDALLDLFWSIHDPTQLNRQGLDVGSQYKSVIFYHNAQQKAKALKSKLAEQKEYGKKIVTEIRPASEFFKAEEYHQKYLEKRSLKTC